MWRSERKKKIRAHKDNPTAEMTFLEHLEELRQRLLISLVSVLLCFVLTYIFFNKTLIKYFTLPMEMAIAGKGRFQFTSPAEGFIFSLKLCFLASVFIASPMLFYQFWKFVAPALYKKEKRYLLPFIILSTVLFVGGALFGYAVVFPYAFRYFATFAFAGIQINPRLDDYFNFATRLLLAFGLVFEFPLVAVFLGRIGLLGPGFFNRNRKYALILIFTTAAILTPGPDVISQLLLAFPLWFLYELSAILVWIFRPRSPSSQNLAG